MVVVFKQCITVYYHCGQTDVMCVQSCVYYDFGYGGNHNVILYK